MTASWRPSRPGQARQAGQAGPAGQARRLGLRGLALLAFGLTPPAAAAAGDAEQGRLLYEQGLVNGTPVQASRPGLGAVPAQAAACVHCHRPSTLGSTEGGRLVPPLAGELLFAPGVVPSHSPRLKRVWLRHQTRSAYTEPLLRRALAQGLDPDGQVLEATMPRYNLDDASVADLAAYLRQRGTGPSSGLVQGVLHVASVVTPQASAARQRTVLSAMAAWSKGMAIGRVPIAWQAWTLTGAPDTWPAQLTAYWLQQPVYALVCGAGGGDWAPVEDACEQHRIACLFPVIDRPPEREDRHWSMYLSEGVIGEARMLANRLASSAQRPTRLVQVHTTPTGAAAARQLRQSLPASAGVAVVDAPADGPTPAWRDGDMLVLWLDSAAASQWLARRPAPPGQGAPQQLVLSGQLAPPATTMVPNRWRPRTLWVSLRADPLRQAAGAALSQAAWTARMALPADLDAQALADVHAATFFFADALGQTRGRWHQDHVLERLEQTMDQRPAGAAYFRLSLGPGQRIAAQGGYLLGYAPPAYERLAALPGFIRADD